jgi:hypothetical protein
MWTCYELSDTTFYPTLTVHALRYSRSFCHFTSYHHKFGSFGYLLDLYLILFACNQAALEDQSRHDHYNSACCKKCH